MGSSCFVDLMQLGLVVVGIWVLGKASTMDNMQLAGVPSLYKDGVGCGACFQVLIHLSFVC